MVDVLSQANLRPKQAAQYLHVSVATFWNYVARGYFKTRKISPRVTLVKKADLDAFIEQQCGQEVTA